MDRDRDDDTDLGARGEKNKAKGNLEHATGKAQEGFGKLTGQKDVEAKGRARQAKGKAQNLGGRVQEGVDDMLDKARDDDRDE